ncbi:MAG: N-acetylmuramic acid 6-phosphate etherase [Thiofilum sp.]|uniref:N-acetylmuramic acid 6-phosphate etherase n=1 Tax=Thiofilum sp. TaxID=2212733 RepID=UPI0025ECAE3B|nr:N-acetylmuramic acid 6-phosphate etherase [Thiofilum sp.]MBK8454786.1 N-acetylmuramic acid 6-phosphate etherase [Thiofilum sp.]
MRLSTQTTETAHPKGQGMDQWSIPQLAHYLCQAQLDSLAQLDTLPSAIARAGEAIVRRLTQAPHSRIIYVGAGSSGAIACLDGMELFGTFGWPRERLGLLLAGGLQSFFDASTSHEDDTLQALKDLTQLNPSAQDVIIAVAASGSTPYTLAVVQRAQSLGCLIIGIANTAACTLLNLADHAILLNTGAEALAGSTRLAAGTAQKLTLNTLSTLVMTQLGYVYDHYMVNLHISNHKLYERALQIIMQITHASRAEAVNALQQAHNQVPQAILILQGLSAEQAHNLLIKHEFRLRSALNAIGASPNR